MMLRLAAMEAEALVVREAAQAGAVGASQLHTFVRIYVSGAEPLAALAAQHHRILVASRVATARVASWHYKQWRRWRR